ncbi:MAG: protein-export chaperone SecB, partial [Gammaproteobacteria bacterium]
MAENDVEAGPSHVGFAELQIQKLYVKDVSFEAPQSPQAFLQEIKPSVEVHLDSRTSRLGENVHEV